MALHVRYSREESSASTARILNGGGSVSEETESISTTRELQVVEGGSATDPARKCSGSDSNSSAIAIAINGETDQLEMDRNNVESSSMRTHHQVHHASSLCCDGFLEEGRLADASGTTILPLREQFRPRRFLPVYHDVRAFTTSWVPLPIFAVYRVVLFLYILSSLIAHAALRSYEDGKWLIFISTWSYTLQMVVALVMAVLTVGYTILYYADKSALLDRTLPPNQVPYYAQDRLPWYVKLCWMLYVTSVSNAFMVMLGYWTFLNNCGGSSSESEATPPTSTDLDLATTVSSLRFVEPTTGAVYVPSSSNSSGECVDYGNLTLHGINVLLYVIDIILSRVPFLLLHFPYPVLFSGFYVVFTGIYYAAGGTGVDGTERYIYPSFDYGENPVSSTLFAILAAVAPMFVYLLPLLLALGRDFVAWNIRWCFRDMQQGSDAVVEMSPDTQVDGYATKYSTEYHQSNGNGTANDNNNSSQDSTVL